MEKSKQAERLVVSEIEIVKSHSLLCLLAIEKKKLTLLR